jgi:hypothetical protein
MQLDEQIYCNKVISSRHCRRLCATTIHKAVFNVQLHLNKFTIILSSNIYSSANPYTLPRYNTTSIRQFSSLACRVYAIEGRQVCQTAYFKASGVPSATFYEYLASANKGELYHGDVPRRSNRMEHTVIGEHLFEVSSSTTWLWFAS